MRICQLHPFDDARYYVEGSLHLRHTKIILEPQKATETPENNASVIIITLIIDHDDDADDRLHKGDHNRGF